MIISLYDVYASVCRGGVVVPIDMSMGEVGWLIWVREDFHPAILTTFGSNFLHPPTITITHKRNKLMQLYV